MKTKYSLIIFGIVTIILHLISFNFFPINYEFTFSEGAKFFDLFEKKNIVISIFKTRPILFFTLL